jgi:8-oxo-dGTP pyrophosphatase MutT (NUDIX family)
LSFGRVPKPVRKVSKLTTDDVRQTLEDWNRKIRLYSEDIVDSRSSSAVLLLLGDGPGQKGFNSEPCLIFNKRSQHVRQAGDLCFPGGAISPSLDPFLARLLRLPLSPLTRWPYWKEWRRKRKEEAEALALLLAAGLREGLEEMRLNPFGGTFLGPLPPQELYLLGKMLYPLVFQVKTRQHYHPNWEVEKVVSIPLKEFLDPDNYIAFRMHFAMAPKEGEAAVQMFPGFLPKRKEEADVLWGATYRIVVTFLEIVFGFSPPEINDLEVIDGFRGKSYFKNGPFNS